MLKTIKYAGIKFGELSFTKEFRDRGRVKRKEVNSCKIKNMINKTNKLVI